MASLIATPPDLTPQQQDRLIRRDWPFRSMLLGDDLGLWRGRIYGLSQGYEVSILYIRQRFQRGFQYGHSWFPEVRVLEPAIVRRTEAPLIPIPHVYDESSDPTLCLFDPALSGWNASQAIAATTIPWVGEWLRFYEAWHATGEWLGGGRDHAATVRGPVEGTTTGAAIRRVGTCTGMETSRIILSTIEARRQAPIARWQLMDAFALGEVPRPTALRPAAVNDLLRRAA